MASTNKCLAQSNKSRTGGEATKKRNRRPRPDKPPPREKVARANERYQRRAAAERRQLSQPCPIPAGVSAVAQATTYLFAQELGGASVSSPNCAPNSQALNWIACVSSTALPIRNAIPCDPELGRIPSK